MHDHTNQVDTATATVRDPMLAIKFDVQTKQKVRNHKFASTFDGSILFEFGKIFSYFQFRNSTLVDALNNTIIIDSNEINSMCSSS